MVCAVFVRLSAGRMYVCPSAEACIGNQRTSPESLWTLVLTANIAWDFTLCRPIFPAKLYLLKHSVRRSYTTTN